MEACTLSFDINYPATQHDFDTELLDSIEIKQARLVVGVDL
jgi:hypothetical protein